MSRATTNADLCRAVLQGIALRTAQVLKTMIRLAGEHNSLSVDGGLINNSYFCQFLSDIAQCEIGVPASPDIMTCGTGRLVLIGSGMVNDLSDLLPAEKPRAIISPRRDLTHLKELFAEAVRRSRRWREN